tara:strand:+ start:558 stop:728 length:171 start_codon:yes stop_codon:yes gene_type:complete
MPTFTGYPKKRKKAAKRRKNRIAQTHGKRKKGQKLSKTDLSRMLKSSTKGIDWSKR